jgi:hypothetical protein
MEITEEHIDFLEPQRCFFYYHHPKSPAYYKELKCPGWIVGQIHLPIVPHYSNKFYLIKDLARGFHWLASNKVSL